MKKRDEQLRKKLLEYAKEISKEEGINAINIRFLAQKAGIATGTVYNYFSCKDEILLALTEEYWHLLTDEIQEATSHGCFYEQLETIFMFLKDRIEKSMGNLMNSLGKTEISAQTKMLSAQREITKILVKAIDKDKNINHEVWNDNFTKQQFSEFVMININMNLRLKADNIDFLIELVKKTIY